MDLRAYPPVPLVAAFGSGQGFEVWRLTGVSGRELLQEAGLEIDSSRRNDLLRAWGRSYS